MVDSTPDSADCIFSPVSFFPGFAEARTENLQLGDAAGELADTLLDKSLFQFPGLGLNLLLEIVDPFQDQDFLVPADDCRPEATGFECRNPATKLVQFRALQWKIQAVKNLRPGQS